MKLVFIPCLVFLLIFLSFTPERENGEKTLILIRHAKSTHDTSFVRDFDRPLEDRGVKDAEKMGKFLAGKGLEIDRIVASPSVRTKQTLDHLFTGGLPYKYSKIVYDSSIYRCKAQAILNMINNTPEGHKTMLIVAHNPATTEMANLLQKDKNWREVPTCGVVVIKFKDIKWTEVGKKKKGKLMFFADPDKL